MVSKLVAWAKHSIHRIVAHVVAFILRPGAVYDPDNFRMWERRGYHITPVHFHHPIPDTRELERVYPRPSMVSGIDLRPEFQLKLLQEVFPQFSAEYDAFPTQPSNSLSFYLDNDAFAGIDPHVYYCMIRYFQPKTIIEVGSGHSTVLGSQGVSKNNTDVKLIVIDPWPRDFTRDFISSAPPYIEHIQQKVEELDAEFLAQLQENDILFVDSSHVVRTAGDVCFLILEILPRLTRGVIVHFHDIFLPFDYPKEWVVEEHNFWTEQYLLQAYLTENSHAEVLFASNFISHEYPEEVRRTFPRALRWSGASFWIRKC